MFQPLLDLSQTRQPSSPAGLAQMVERKTLNLVVVGSIPTGGAFWGFEPSGWRRSGP